MRGGVHVPAVGFVLAVCLLLAGCGDRAPAGPPTVPIKGRVEFTKGGSAQNLSNHSVAVEFESVEQPEMKAYGAILEDGSFTMTTQVGDKGKTGVVAGTHRVRLNADDSGARFVAAKFLSFDTSGITVKVPADGEIVIKVWR